ncbi:MAG TPA: fluoride efflux transporter CrcB [Candidatus Kapabacteria bacterium]
MKELILVALGGAIGSVARYAAGGAARAVLPERHFIGTFAVNIIGSLIIGALFAKVSSLGDDMFLLAAVGFCGGFTTFSALSLEALRLIQSGEIMTALLYAVGSVIVGLGACWLGYTAFR